MFDHVFHYHFKESVVKHFILKSTGFSLQSNAILKVKIGALDLPVLYGDKVHCLDVLFALVKRIMGEVEISEDMRKEAEIRLLKSFPNRKTLKAETTTLALRQQARAARIIQVFICLERYDNSSIYCASNCIV